jgi:putative ABC transport system permease protein
MPTTAPSDDRTSGLDAPARPALYIPFAQRLDNWGWLSWQIVMVRIAPGLDVAAVGASVRDAVWSLDDALPIQSMTTVEGLYAESTARRRFAMQLAAGFAALALLLCAVGIYGVVAHAVAERRREIGLRIALGARPRQVVASVMRAAFLLAAGGVALGTLSAAGLTGFLRTLLFEIDPIDPAGYGIMAGLLLLVAALAAWVPARRATSVDPVTALRLD